ncbi:MAG: DUF1206 domain-containing protein [Thermoanaerobaculia bacterium]
MADRRAPAARRYGFLARLGHFARGIVYIAMGIWTGRAAVFSHASAVGPGEALESVLGGREGRLFAGLVALGFLADAVFRILQAATAKNRGFLARASLFVRGIGAAALGITAFQVYRHVQQGREGRMLREIVAWVMAHPSGTTLIVVIGLVAVALGAREILEGATGRLRETFVKKTMGRLQKRWAMRVARIGLATHGTLIVLTGYFLVRAGLGANPRAVVLSGGALRRVGHLPFGAAILAGLAAGVIAYGLAQWVLGFYRRAS